MPRSTMSPRRPRLRACAVGIAVIAFMSPAVGAQASASDSAPLVVEANTRTDGLQAEITGVRSDGGRDLATDPYARGEQVPYTFHVKNTSDQTVTVTPESGAFAPFLPPGAGNCRYQSLAAGAEYTCTTARHTVTRADVARGYFVGTTTWSVRASGAPTTILTVDAGEVDLVERSPHITVAASGVWNDADGDGLASAGETVTWERSVLNDGNVRLDSVQVAGVEIGAMRMGGRFDLADVTEVLTPADIAAGRVAPAVVSASGTNGSKPASVQNSRPQVLLPTAANPIPEW